MCLRLGVAERAGGEALHLGRRRAVLACAAEPELGLCHRLAADDAGQERNVALLAAGRPGHIARGALHALDRLAARVLGRVPGEDLQGQGLIGLALLRGERLQANESLGADAVGLVGEGGNGQQRVRLHGVEDVVVLGEAGCRAQRVAGLARVELALGQEEEVHSLCAAPCRLDDAAVGLGGAVLREEAVEGRDGVAAGLLLVLESLDLQRSEDIELLGTQALVALLHGELSLLEEQASGIQEVVCLAVELNGLQGLVLAEQMRGVLCQQRVNVHDVVLLGQLHGQIPLVEADADVDGVLDAAGLAVKRHRLRGHPDRGKHGANVAEQLRAFGELRQQALQALVVLQAEVALRHAAEVAALRVVLEGLLPALAVGIVVANLVHGALHHRVAAAAGLQQLDDTEPVAQLHPQVHSEVRAVHLLVDALSVLKAAKVCGHLGLLFALVVELAQALHNLHALIVARADKGLVGNVKVQLGEGCLGQQPPQTRVRVLLDKGVCVVNAHAFEEDAGVAQRLDVAVLVVVACRALGVLHDVVEVDGADAEVLKLADVAVGENGLLRIQIAEDVHVRALHHGKQLRVVGGPTHVPDVLADKGLQVLAVDDLARLVDLLHLGIKQRQAAGKVDDGQTRGVAVERNLLRPAVELVLDLEGDARQAVLVDSARFASNHQHRAGHADTADRVMRLLLGLLELGWVVLHTRGVVNVEDLLRLGLLVVVHLLVCAHVVPNIDALARGGDNVRACHRHKERVDVDLLRVDGRANGVADDERELVGIVLGARDEHAVIAGGGNVNEVLHVL
eukprot:m.90374 g.90374  ORF g.90374 m.90374 type:complete len:795 (+) comp15261_c1_seq1:282-2666(+)